MADSPLDSERIAALLDGRLRDPERARVLALLAADPDWCDIAIDAASAVDDTAGTAETPTADESSPKVRAPAKQRRARLWLGLVAAASIGVTILTRDIGLAGSELPAFSPALATSLVLTSAERVILTQDRWNQVRAGAADLSPGARSVRLGALSVDLFLSGDDDATDVRREMRDLLASVDGAAAVSRLLDAASDSAQLDASLASVRALALRDSYDAGVWLELHRVGARADVRPDAIVTLLRRAADGLPRTPDEEADIDARIRALEEALHRQDLAAEREAVNGLLRVMGT